MRQRFEEAINAFRRIPVKYPTNSLVPLAFGRIADCYFQLGAGDSTRYEGAVTNYQEVIKSPEATVSGPAVQAEFGLGKYAGEEGRVVGKTNGCKGGCRTTEFIRRSFESLLDVLYEKNLRRGEEAEPVGSGKPGSRRDDWPNS
jgi:hypothetical protein